MAVVVAIWFLPSFAALSVRVAGFIGQAIVIVLPFPVLVFVVLAVFPAPLVIGIAVVGMLVTISIMIAITIPIPILIMPLLVFWQRVVIEARRRCLQQSRTAKGQNDGQHRLFCPHLPSM
jgi:hypothetical protein